MKIILLHDILVIFGVSVVVLYFCHRMRIPSIVGFLFTGVLAGPYGLGLVEAVEAIEILAEVGVVLLLFAIGLEFSLKNLIQIRTLVLLGGSLQMLMTFLATFLAAWALGLSLTESTFVGFLVCLSSTAIVMKVLQERGEVETPHGQTTLGILIFQDLMVVPMMLATPLLSGQSQNLAQGVLIFIAEGAGMILLVFIGSKYLVPWILFKIAQTRIRELFLLSVVLICILIAWLTHLAGLSLALGAFLAGLIISESEYSHQVFGNILPFRDLFTSFFFVSIGMLLDLRFFGQHPGTILLITLSVLILKALLAGFAALIVGLPLRTLILVGFGLSQVGEFSFILSRTGVESGLLTSQTYQFLLDVSICTMAATPFVIALAPLLADRVLRWPLPRKLKRGSYPVRGAKPVHEKDHLIIVGFGINGKNIARAAKASAIPYVIIEMNPEIVREERAKGEPIHYGDATQEAVLRHGRIQEAKSIVIAINDPAATRRITELARRLNRRLHIIVRTRYLKEMGPLYELGANEVIPEEFETSVEIFSRVLGKYLQPKEEIERFVAKIRSEGYEMFRSISKEATSCLDIAHCLPDVEMKSFRVSEGAPILDLSLAQTEMRKKFGVNVLAIRRDSDLIYNPSPDTRFQKNDLVVLMGQPEGVERISGLFRGAG